MPRYMYSMVAAALLLTACQSSPQPQRSAAPPLAAPAAAPRVAPAPAPQVSRATPTRDEQTCLLAVTTSTGNGDVVLLTGTETSEANNAVYIGVGPNRARWRCLVKNGRVAEVMSLTNEGRL